jgi:hypothetical protein
LLKLWNLKAVKGKSFNVRPSGESTVRLKLANLPDTNGYKVKIGDLEAQPAWRIPAGVAAIVPNDLLGRVGLHRVILIDGSTNQEIHVGTFEVLTAD